MVRAIIASLCATAIATSVAAHPETETDQKPKLGRLLKKAGEMKVQNKNRLLEKGFNTPRRQIQKNQKDSTLLGNTRRLDSWGSLPGLTVPCVEAQKMHDPLATCPVRLNAARVLVRGMLRDAGAEVASAASACGKCAGDGCGDQADTDSGNGESCNQRVTNLLHEYIAAVFIGASSGSDTCDTCATLLRALAPVSFSSCSCSWLNVAAGHTCGARITWLMSSQGKTKIAAGQQVASEFPSECGACEHIVDADEWSQCAPLCAEGKKAFDASASCPTRVNAAAFALGQLRAAANIRVAGESFGEGSVCSGLPSAGAASIATDGTGSSTCAARVNWVFENSVANLFVGTASNGACGDCEEQLKGARCPAVHPWDDPRTRGLPTWKTAYKSGDSVVFQGALFKANWWTLSKPPLIGGAVNPHGPWSCLCKFDGAGAAHCPTGSDCSACQAAAPVQATCTVPSGTKAWSDPSQPAHFKHGDKVTFGGAVFQAKWWTTEAPPTSGDKKGGPWKCLCKFDDAGAAFCPLKADGTPV